MNFWSIPPNWANGVTETLAWLTDMMKGQSGAEQRRQMRLSPRRTIEYDFWCEGPARTLFDLMVTRGGADTWLVPLWWDGGRLDESFGAGSPAVLIDTTFTEFFAGTQVVFYLDEFNWEIHTISAVSTTVLQFLEVTSRFWPAGTRVMPLRAARLTDQPSISKLTSKVAQGTVRFQMTGNNDFTPAFAGDLYGTYSVLIQQPNARDATDVSWERLTTQLDDTVSIVNQTDTANIGFYKQKHPLTLYGKQDHNALRGMLYALKGALTPIWLPSFAEDFEIVDTSYGSTITVNNTGYADYGIGLTGKQDLQFVMTDGYRFYARITGATNLGNGTERLQLSLAQFGGPVARSNTSRISFVTLSRQEADSIEIAHLSDMNGVTESTLAFISSPEIRNVV